MSTFEYIVLLWVLPSLVSSLIYIGLEKTKGNGSSYKKPGNYDKGDWTVLFVLSVIYPIGFLFYLIFIIDNYGGFLTKELW